MKCSIDVHLIKLLLPHRYPFLLLDKVIDIVPGKSAIGLKYVSANEPYFQGHFPNNPIVPGVLLVESIAQLSAVMLASLYFPENYDFSRCDTHDVDFTSISSHAGYLADIKNFKFRKTVRPGCVIEINTKVTARLSNLIQVKAEAYVDRNLVCEGSITVSEN